MFLRGWNPDFCRKIEGQWFMWFQVSENQGHAAVKGQSQTYPPKVEHGSPENGNYAGMGDSI